MKLLSLVLVSVGLCLGAVGAGSAYSPNLSLPDDRLVGLTLIAPAGGARATADAPATPPIVSPGREGAVLTAETLAQLRAAGVRHVRVKEFRLSNWPGRWMLLAGAVLLVAGAAAGRAAAKRPAIEVSARSARSPEEVLASLRAQAEALRVRIAPVSDDDARREIIKHLGEMQQDGLPAFVASRDAMIARGGLGYFASVMDRFSAAERQIARSWSAAADGYAGEARASLENAVALLAETGTRLGAR